MLTTVPKGLTVLLLTAFAFGCGSDDTATAEGPMDAGVDALEDASTDTPIEAAPDVTPDAADEAADAELDPIATVTILQTGDERGWLSPVKTGNKMVGGAANVAARWKDVEGYSPETHLVLSSGDSWLGGAASTWLKGESTVQVMNLMGYRAVTLGSRDYDFGRDELEQRINEADFSFVSANTLYADTGAVVDYVTPYQMFTIDGVQVAVIGLMDVNQDVNPADIADLSFAGYMEALEQYAFEARAKGANVVIALSSGQYADLSGAMDTLSAPVDIVFAGTAAAASQFHGEVPLITSNSGWSGYHRVQIDFDRVAGQVIDRKVEWVPVEYDVADGNPVTPDPAVEAEVQQWEVSVDAVLGHEIGYCGATIGDWTMANWVTDAWLWKFPEADIAIQNSGGLKTDIPPGPITIGDLVEVFPHENYIYEVQMTGADIVADLTEMVEFCANKTCFVAVAGMQYKKTPTDVSVTLADGNAIDPNSTYTVLINSYIYAGGAGFPYDPNLEITKTGAHYRDPVIEWTEQLHTSTADPLENYLDSVPRNQ